MKAANDKFSALAAQMEALTKAVTSLQQKEKADVRTVSLEQAENAKLQDANQKLAGIASQMEVLKKVVTTLQEKQKGGVRTAALEQ